MEAIRKSNPGAYRQPRWHFAADAESSRTICGKDVAEIKGDRRGSWQRGRVERRDADGMSEYEICTVCRNKARGGSSSVRMSVAEMKALLARVSEAADKAWAEAVPTPMVVYTPRDMMASLMGGDDGGADPNEPVYQINEGICGRAWVKIRPGGSRFARWLIKEGYGRTNGYNGGVDITPWNHGGSQSFTRWSAAAYAAAEVLRDAGINAYADTWID